MDVEQVACRLECVEGDSEGQEELQLADICPEKTVYVAEDEVSVLDKREHSEVGKQHSRHCPPRAGLCPETAEVSRGRREQDEKEIGWSGCQIVDIGKDQQPNPLVLFRNHIVACRADRGEDHELYGDK